MALEKLYITNKHIGETPLEALERLRQEKGIAMNIPMTYAGRLDPMAEGLLLILAGEECKKKEEYLGLDKEYIVEVLFGFGTDTGDLLGKITRSSRAKLTAGQEDQTAKVVQVLKSLEGKFVQEYPVFSSKIISMTPFYAIAEKGDMEILGKAWPTKEVEIYSIELLGMRQISSKNLLSYIEETLVRVQGDFRQNEILKDWRKALGQLEGHFLMIKIKVRASSGTYMRLLAERIGESLEVSALAYSISRFSIGEYKLL